MSPWAATTSTAATGLDTLRASSVWRQHSEPGEEPRRIERLRRPTSSCSGALTRARPIRFFFITCCAAFTTGPGSSPSTRAALARPNGRTCGWGSTSAATSRWPTRSPVTSSAPALPIRNSSRTPQRASTTTRHASSRTRLMSQSARLAFPRARSKRSQRHTVAPTRR